jgi:hypothetical protein
MNTDKNNNLRLIIRRVVNESINENIFSDMSDFWVGTKGAARGYGKDYFSSMSKIRRLIKNLKKLDQPNLKVIDEMETLKTKIQSFNIPQNRKQALIYLLDNSILKFREYNNINDQILTQIESLNLDSWS